MPNNQQTINKQRGMITDYFYLSFINTCMLSPGDIFNVAAVGGGFPSVLSIVN